MSIRRTGIYRWLPAKRPGAAKKIFLRVAPAAGGALAHYDTAAPIEFEKLLHLIADQPQLLADIDALLAQKRAAPELGLAPAIPGINAFVESELARLESIKPAPHQRGDMVPALSDVFRTCLQQAWT